MDKIFDEDFTNILCVLLRTTQSGPTWVNAYAVRGWGGGVLEGCTLLEVSNACERQSRRVDSACLIFTYHRELHRITHTVYMYNFLYGTVLAEPI